MTNRLGEARPRFLRDRTKALRTSRAVVIAAKAATLAVLTSHYQAVRNQPVHPDEFAGKQKALKKLEARFKAIIAPAAWRLGVRA